MIYIWLIVLSVGVIYLLYTVGKLMDITEALRQLVVIRFEQYRKRFDETEAFKVLVEKRIEELRNRDGKEEPKKTTTKKKTTKKDAA